MDRRPAPPAADADESNDAHRSLRRERRLFRDAVEDCLQRGLHQSAKWASQQLTTLRLGGGSGGGTAMRARQADADRARLGGLAGAAGPAASRFADADSDASIDAEDETNGGEDSDAPDDDDDADADDDDDGDLDDGPAGPHPFKWDRDMTQRQRDKHLLALCYFNCRDFGMAVQTLAAAKHPTMLFLRLYSQFLMASRKLNFDRRLSSERNQSSDKPRQPDPSSPLAPLYFEMQQLKENRELTDPFIMYLYGLVSLKLELVDVGLEALGQSLAIYPHNWSAWIEFFPCANQDGISRPHFSKMKSLIRHCLPKRLALLWENDPLGDEDLVVEAERMELIFKNNIYLRLAKARLLYYLSDYEQCRQIWKSLYQENPYLLDMADNYSDVLYTMQCRVELNAFVQRCDKIDRFRPETCCAIANFFALRGEYPKAIDYIKQAIKLHSSNSSYWVVLGLFYADLKNPNAAIEAYRTAIEIDKTNHKAWNMLGVSYNMLQIPSFAIFYFKRALTLKDDPRYWSGLGSCYANLDRDHEAIACYRRAILQTDPLEYSRPEAAAMMEMAKLNERIGRLDLAEKCFANLFAHYEMKDNFVDLQEAVDAAVFLARRAIDDGRWGDAARYAEKIAESEEGRSLLNKIGSRNR